MQPNQWQQQQYGYNPQFQQQQGYGQQQQRPNMLGPQATGFPGQPQQQRPQPTGFQPQPTGMGGMGGMGGAGPGAGGNFAFLNAPPVPGSFGQQRSSMSGQGGMTPQMTGFPGGGASGLMPQQTGYPGLMSQPTGMGGGMMPQQTGMGGLRPQPTGIHDPRLGAMMQTFMPSNTSQPFSASGVPQFNQSQQQPLTHTFQTLLQNPSVKTPKIPWTLSRQEKKDYDQIFRAWDQKGDGFISGEMAREVFGQSGLGQDDLMKIWNLSDVDNRGKLNLPEFHVAMGLIYRGLNGNEIPDKLPEELVPASMRDIDSTVNFMRDLLKHESSTRSDTSTPVGYSGTPVSVASSKDAKVYKHDDNRNTSYKSSSRHLDRKAVRYAGEDSGAEISDLRRQLENTSSMLDESAKISARRTEEDDMLEQEVEDIKYRVRRIKEDIEYVSKGRRTTEKDEERRKLEREMLYLMHEKLPELERRQERRQEEKRMEERAGIRARDRRNDVHGRYDDRDRDGTDWLRGSYDRRGSRDDRDDRDRRGSFNRDDRDRRGSRDDRDRRGSFNRDDRDDRDRYDTRDRDRYDDRDRRGSRDDRDRYDRDREAPHDLSKSRAPVPPSPPKTASPKPEKPAQPASTSKSMASMTPEERKAYVKEQAQRRIQERLRALGVESASPEPTVDTSVEERLERERKEAAEKAKAADAEQEAREHARQERIRAAGGGGSDEPASKAAPAAPPVKSALKKPGPPPPAPSPRKDKPPAPTPRHGAAPVPPAPRSPVKKAAPPEDPEEAELRKQEEARQKAIAERRERLKRLQEEEEEETRKEEELLAQRKARSAAASTPSVVQSSVTSPPASTAGSYNPFHRPRPTGGSQDASMPTSPGLPKSPNAGGYNPFSRPQGSTTDSSASIPPPPPPPPAPPVQQTTRAADPVAAAQAPPPPPPPPPPGPPVQQQAWIPPARTNSAPPDDDWDAGGREIEADDSDSSDDEYAKSRTARAGLASALFGGPSTGSPAGSRPGSAAPKAAPPAALANLGGGAPTGGGMSALLSSIQGGARLRHAETVDKSGPGVSGRIIGDAAPPAHIKVQADSPPPSPPMTRSPEPAAAAVPSINVDDDFVAGNPNRQSTDWYGALAADNMHPAAAYSDSALEPTREEREEEERAAAEAPANTNGSAAAGGDDGPSLDDVDLGTTLRVRTLYDYASSFDGDLPFKENSILEAHPSKDPNGPWWFATDPSGNAGWIPGSYVKECVVTPCHAIYDYSGQGSEELSFSAGEQLSVVDQTDPDWWKVESSGSILLVPAAYVQVLGDKPVAPAPAQLRQETKATAVPLLTSPTSANGSRAAQGPRSPQDMNPTFTVASPEQTSFPDRSEVLTPGMPVRTQALALAQEEGATPNRSRAASVSQYSVATEDDGDDSDADSVLSFWSSDGDESDTDAPPAASDAASEEIEKEKKEVEKKRREGERQRALAAAGLKIRREPPGIPAKAPAARRRRAAPAVPSRGNKPSRKEHKDEGPEPQADHDIEVKDAYARYEQFLAEAKNRPVAPPVARPTPARPMSLEVPGAGGVPSHTPSPAPSAGNTTAAAKLTGFLSRMSTVVTGGGGEAPKPRVSISGPIVSGPMCGGPIGGDSEDGTASAAPSDFGRTWSSLVDPSALESMTETERKRQESIFEFIATESSYVRDLQLIVGVFYGALMHELDDRALKVIFANVEDILMLNTFFLSALEERQKQCRLYVDRIGDILAEHMQNVDVYMPYCVNQDQAAKLLLQMRRDDPALEKILQGIRDTNPAVRGLDLSSFLLEPMQRITRYPLLLRQIAHYTQPDQDLDEVQSALTCTEGIVAQINESVREAESHERLRVLSEDLWVGGEGRIDLTEPTACQGPRKLIKEGAVAKAKSGRKLWMVLCTDVLILIESRNLYRMPIPLHDVLIQQGRDDVSFALVMGSGKRDVIRLKAPTNKDRVEWVATLSRARKETLQARESSGAASHARRPSARDSGDYNDNRTSAYINYNDNRASVYSTQSTGSGRSRRISRAYSDYAPSVQSPVAQYSGQQQAFSPVGAPPTLPPRPPSSGDMLDPVYDDAHSYAGTRGHNLYNHEF